MANHLIGGLAAVASAVSFGSFAVPIKSPAVVQAKVHPLIFQSYKSLICFLSSWLLLLWAEFRFTWLGLIAGLIWVHNGVLAICSIHMSGLGIAQSIWSGVSIAVSFIWGKTLFHEPMENSALAVTGLLLMILGMAGLGWTANRFGVHENPSEGTEVMSVDLHRLEGGAQAETAGVVAPKSGQDTMSDGKGAKDSPDETLELQNLVTTSASDSDPSKPSWLDNHKLLVGGATAAWVGVAAGSMMICLKLAPPDCKGDQYAMSFGLGVGVDTVIILAIYFAACQSLKRDPARFQPRVAAAPAMLAGFLWTVGNYLSVIAVGQLGMGVGFPIVQSNLIISNMWALFYYKEIQGRKAIICFFVSTAVIIVGVCFLAAFGL